MSQTAAATDSPKRKTIVRRKMEFPREIYERLDALRFYPRFEERSTASLIRLAVRRFVHAEEKRGKEGE